VYHFLFAAFVVEEATQSPTKRFDVCSHIAGETGSSAHHKGAGVLARQASSAQALPQQAGALAVAMVVMLVGGVEGSVANGPL
jgi:hypothetical protein